jgi:hypothetical protein
MKFINFTYTLLAIAVSAQEAPVAPQEIIEPPQGGSVVPQEIIEPPQGGNVLPQDINEPSREISTLPKEKCPGPFEVMATNLRAYFSNMEFTCSNFNRNTGCLHRYHKTPNENDSPGGCKRRNEPPVMDALIWNYDCKSARNHWSFASEMVNKYNLTCNFVKKSAYY